MKPAQRIDRWLWPHLCRRRGFLAVLSTLLGIFLLEGAFPELADLALGSVVAWALFNAAVFVAAFCVIESRARYLAWSDWTKRGGRR
jgi:hypothetical protein